MTVRIREFGVCLVVVVAVVAVRTARVLSAGFWLPTNIRINLNGGSERHQ